MNRTTSSLLWWILLAFGLLVLGLLLTRASVLEAAEVRSGDTVFVAAGELIEDDLVVAGNAVTVDGTILGDLIVAATDVTINGMVEGSVMVAAQTVTIDGTIDGSLYAGVTDIILQSGATVERNLYVGAYSVIAESGSAVKRSVYIGAYQALLRGTIERNVNVGAGALELSGFVGGDVNAEIDATGDAPIGLPFVETQPVPNGVRLTDSAQINGVYNVNEVTTLPAPTFSDTLRERGGELVALLVIGALLIWVRQPLIDRLTAHLDAHPANTGLWGAFALIVVPIALFVLLMATIFATVLGSIISFGRLAPTVVGLGGGVLALSVILFVFVIALFSKVIVAFFVGEWILTRTNATPNNSFLPLFSALAIGVLLFELLRLIPVVGAIITLLTVLLGMGAITLTLRERIVGSAEPIVAEKLATV